VLIGFDSLNNPKKCCTFLKKLSTFDFLFISLRAMVNNFHIFFYLYALYDDVLEKGKGNHKEFNSNPSIIFKIKIKSNWMNQTKPKCSWSGLSGMDLVQKKKKIAKQKQTNSIHWLSLNFFIS